ncbi:histidine--tRNA ligase [Chromobacterium subtsugae]|uniref:Histidine--tRNA ligase n=1 Tax=Chromobacterium subtsugae TaxID=251747 RepID=A0ABS7FJD3_9NEIS|nr:MULTISPECIES: histidine--tRNA ligase [Chromobacterium]KUM03305.1 histidine--tRNA ligase [Chromobacterium subtsugae]KZE86805.1 histidine--tRNA ligase [Chromobacterium sp. F49]MBW7569102.1 histidine--tRNA ligase [Chromobacterium subtsugae]MBW8290172.1 histidine--tRNA ligase [Chromobacterium subtsugae]OBU86652.1 histidyl-tRNA synthase [Chromobacterium subtsugae]
MSQKYQAVKGMNDVLPAESYQWEYFEGVLRKLLADYGYQNIRTPIVEGTPLFVRSIGEVTDIVEKEMYTFVDSLNGDSLTLRPEGTAGTLRAVVEHNLLYNAAPKLWYMGPMYRHERPQKGRYRQFHQVGVEALGLAGPDIDAEIIAMTADLWRRLGISQYVRLEINSLGNAEERAAHREALIAYLEGHVDILDEDGKRRLYTNPLRVLDTKNPALQEMADNAPKLSDYLGEESRAHYAGWKAMIAALGIEFVENPRLVRGLDYYNRSVFEWVTSELGAQGTVCAGGRYDGLVEQLGGKAAPGIGFGMGMERVLLLLQDKNLLPAQRSVDVYLVNQGEGAGLYSMKLAQTLRAAGYSVVQHLGEASFKSQMKKADGSGAEFALIVGENEIQAGQVVIKALRADIAQQTVAADAVLATLATLKA